MIDYDELKHNKNWLSPVQVAIKEFGGNTKLSKLIGITESSVSKWTYRGPLATMHVGMIPAKHQYRLLQIAKEMRIKLTAKDLIFGRIIK